MTIVPSSTERASGVRSPSGKNESSLVLLGKKEGSYDEKEVESALKEDMARKRAQE